MARRPLDPIMPASKTDPAGQSRRIREAMARVDKAIRAAEASLLLALKNMPVRAVNAARYDYQIDLDQLRIIVDQIAAQLRAGIGPVQQAAGGAYTEGTAAASVNLSRLTEDYARPLTSLLSSEPFLRRSSLIGARVFEEMDGFAGETARDLGRVLMQGMQDGRNPLDVARDIKAQFAASKVRAERIARTEINGALRRGRLDEAQDAQERLGIKTGMLWASALSPTTRASHAKRHGRVYSLDEVRDFYSRSGEGVNCKCTQVEVLLDDNGKPTSTRAIERMAKARKAFEDGE